MPARYGDLRRQPVGLDETPYDALGFVSVRLRRGVEEELRPVASDHHHRAEPLPGLVVQVERAQPLAGGVAVLVVVELDLDAELVVHAEDATSALARALMSSSPRGTVLIACQHRTRLTSRQAVSMGTAASQKSSLRPVESLTTPRNSRNSSSDGSVGVPP